MAEGVRRLDPATLLRGSVGVAALVAIAAIAATGFGESPLPVAGVVKFSGLVMVEAIIVLSILRPGTFRHSWGRALVALGACLVALWFSAQNTLGAGEYVFMHQRWLVVLAVLCLVFFIVSLYGLRRDRS